MLTEQVLCELREADRRLTAVEVAEHYPEAIGLLLDMIEELQKPIPLLIEIKHDTVEAVVVEAKDAGRVVYDTMDRDIIDNEDGEYDDADASAQFSWHLTGVPHVLPAGQTIVEFMEKEAECWQQERGDA